MDEDQFSGLSRRRFLQVMAASMSLAGLTLSGCRRWPEQKLAPYASRPEGRKPGEPVYYATMFEQAGVATGILAESFDGRPIKIEGNPKHPFSNGATDAFAQASILALYDPERSQAPRQRKGQSLEQRTWTSFKNFVDEHFAERKGDGSSGVAVLAEPTASPTHQALREKFQQVYPEANWYEWAPINRDNTRAGLKRAFGRPLREQLHLDKAQVLACFDADPLGDHPASVRHERDWAKGRRAVDQFQMSRVYAAEPTFTRVGGVADERLPVRSSHVPRLVTALAARLGVISGSGGDLNGSSRFIEMLANDLTKHPGESLVLVGEDQPAQTHALAWAINEHLGNLGRTVTFIDEPMGDAPAYTEQLGELVGRINSDELDTLIILGGNPAYDAPADSGFAEALERVETTIHLSQYVDETSLKTTWHLPRAHYLECWGDGRAWDGTVSVQQPQIMPLFDDGSGNYGGRSPIEVLALLSDEKQTAGDELVRRHFNQTLLGTADPDFEKRWRRVLHQGLLEGSAAKTVQPSLREAVKRASAPQPIQGDFELVFRADEKLYDGQWANNGWLQELPGSITHLTWDNAALMSVADARRMNVRSGDMVELTVGKRKLTIPALPMPGHSEGAIVVTLGYGRTAAGHVGGLQRADGGTESVGFDTYKLRTTGGMQMTPVSVRKTGAHHELATTTHHDMLDVSDFAQKGVAYRAGDGPNSTGSVIKSATLSHFQQNPRFAQKTPHGDVKLQLFEPTREGEWPEPAHKDAPEIFNDPHAWGMVIDMTACTGCNSCVVACQSENNVPVVGRDEVMNNREMHWLRIDRYFQGGAENPELVHQPMMCVHCENAPCEQVCPVNASVHDSEGLNLQVYNRCIGTRYCSNNCPYKVRRFNFFDYHSQDPRGTGIPGLVAKPWLGIPDQEQKSRINEIKQMVFNPDVTVRMRGVMEKCTYCVQRISRAKIFAKNEYAKGNRTEPTVQDGEVVTACQSACPTQAIVFGDLNDKNSEVSRLHRSKRAYKTLDPELNTRPRTQHLAKISNPAKV